MRSRYQVRSGIVLKRRSHPNGDTFLTLLGPDGKWTALARSGRASAGMSGRLTLFSDFTVQQYSRAEGGLPVITQVSLNGSLARLTEPGLYGLAHVLAELADSLTVDVHHGEPLYGHLASGLRGLCISPDPEAVALAYSWGMLRVAGLAPVPGSCGVCGSDRPVATLDIVAGRFICGGCTDPSAVSPVAADVHELLSVPLGRGVLMELADRRGHWQLLSRYCAHHAGPLKSIALLNPDILEPTDA